MAAASKARTPGIAWPGWALVWPGARAARRGRWGDPAGPMGSM